jgi:hypothetical protein
MELEEVIARLLAGMKTEMKADQEESWPRWTPD